MRTCKINSRCLKLSTEQVRANANVVFKKSLRIIWGVAALHRGSIQELDAVEDRLRLSLH